jgi:hypothetical protein
MGTLNTGAAVGAGVVGTGQYIGRTKWARAYYDFATDAGAVGALNLRGDKIPSGARVLSAHIDVATIVTSGGAATVSIGVESATDIRAAATLGTAPSLAAVACPVSAAVNRGTAAVKTTAERHIVATIATAALTAGRFSVLVEYVELHSAV